MYQQRDEVIRKLGNEWGLFAIERAILECHKLIDGCKTRREQSIEYAICTSFGKALTTFEEIIILLANGYSDGAFALARTLYENYTIAMFLNKHYRKHDELLGKYFDAYDTAEVKCEKTYYEGILYAIEETKLQNSNTLNLKEQLNETIQTYNEKKRSLQIKYPSARFSNDYWWVSGVINDISFNGIQDDVGHPLLKAHYKFACARVHSSSYNNMYRSGIDTDDIIYSATFKGFERPLVFALIIFRHFFALFSKVMDLNSKGIVAELNPSIKKYKKYFFGIS